MEKLSYAVEQRVRMIDLLIDQYGSINRRVIMDCFGIGEATASRDIQIYLNMAEMNCVYDKSKKTYFKTACFERVYP